MTKFNKFTDNCRPRIGEIFVVKKLTGDIFEYVLVVGQDGRYYHNHDPSTIIQSYGMAEWMLIESNY